MDTNNLIESPMNENKIQIYIKTITGIHQKYEVTDQITITELQQLFCQTNNITRNIMASFYFEGKLIKRNKKLSDYSIKNDDIIHVTYRLPGGILFY